MPFDADALVYFNRTWNCMSMWQLFNPYRTTIVPVLQRCSPILHVIQFMPAFQTGKCLKVSSIEISEGTICLRQIKFAQTKQLCVIRAPDTMILRAGRTTACCETRVIEKIYCAGKCQGSRDTSVYNQRPTLSAFSADTLEPPLNFDSQTGEVDPLVGVGSELFALVSLLG
jgi:hypothetical protein